MSRGMAAPLQPQPHRPIHRAFDQHERKTALEILAPLLRVHTSTPTNNTCTRNFPLDNIAVSTDEHGDWSMWTTPQASFWQDFRESAIFIGARPVEVGSGHAMTYIISYNAHVGGKVEIPHETLRLICAPPTAEATCYILKYVDGARILRLLRHSVETGRPLLLRPSRFDGSFESSNPLLNIGDLILQVVYADTGDSAGMLDDRIIPSPSKETPTRSAFTSNRARS